MYTTDNLKPGDFVMPLPVGLQLTIEYNTEGSIAKVYTGYKDRTDITKDIIGILIAKKTVPAKIHITGCDTWVFGVLYTSETISKTADIPDGIKDDLLSFYLSNPLRFNFFAASVECSNGSILGSIAIRRALAMQQFKILPGWDLLSNFNDKLLSLWMQEGKYTFKPVVTDLVALGRDSGLKYTHLGARQIKVDTIVNVVDDNGFLKSYIAYRDALETISINYADRVHFNIEKGTTVYFNRNQEILFSDTMTSAKQPAPIKCKKCGKLIEIPARGTARCENVHCISRLVPVVQAFVGCLGLPKYDNVTVKSWVDKQAITCISDIFLLDEYKDCKLEVSIASLLRAMIPYDIIARDDVLMLFTTACMENPKTVEYYMLNPEQIPTDLRIQHMDLQALIDWFLDDCNVSDMSTLLTLPQITIADRNKKFDGAPIFRDKIIFITGTFLHGSLGYVASILQSYSAKVTTAMSNNVDLVLVGGTHENIDGRAITTARQLHIPISEELDFFAAYDIDTDIAEANKI
jgi:hypothetical protein